VIQASGIGAALGGRGVLHDVSTAVRPGEVLALAGPNGAGKTTLMRVLSGDLAARGGSVEIEGRRIDAWPARDLALVRAVLPQRSELEFPFPVWDVVALGRTPHRRPGSAGRDADVIRWALRLTETEGLAHRAYTALSIGERQRVQLARVLAQLDPEGRDARPRYLFLDEPTNNLDPSHQHRLLRLARRIAARGVGVLAVLHDLNLVAQYADRVALMRDGRVISQGPLATALTAEHIRASFSISAMVIPHPCMSCPLVVTHAGLEPAAAELQPVLT
jgi:iron complex transport system ATP-binding protein